MEEKTIWFHLDAVGIRNWTLYSTVRERGVVLESESDGLGNRLTFLGH